jgi:hypothetical protein
MPFDPDISDAIHRYINVHMADEEWHHDFFTFVSDADLATRLAQEFLSARTLYKLLEGLRPDDWLLTAQVKVQVLMYASIYEATLHHLLFDRFATDARVIELLEQKIYKRFSIPAKSSATITELLSHADKQLIAMYETTTARDETKIRFDEKAQCAADIGLIDSALCAELVSIYSARNAIHLHAELRKGLVYELDLSRMAYRRMQVFREQVMSALKYV